MRHGDWRSLVAFTAAGLIVGACNGASPMSPSRSDGASSAVAKSSPPGVVTALSSGNLTVTTRQGTLTGTYTGEANGTAGTFSVALTGGTGPFDGASGTLTGDGGGDFTGESGFSLVLDGVMTTAAGSRKLKINVKGTSTFSCVNQVPFLTLTGSAQVTGSGSSTAVLSHRVGNLSCSG